MGDRCYLQIRLRAADLPRFATHIGAAPKEEWWDGLNEEPGGIVTAEIHEANYSWLDERQAAAEAGIPFHGCHGEGGCYGPYAFASLDNRLLEAPLSHDGEFILVVDEDLKPLDDGEQLRAYVAAVKQVEAAFQPGEARAAA